VASLDDTHRPGEGGTFDVAVIPHTLAVTTLGTKQPGQLDNLEVDVLAKYVERLLTMHSSEQE
jgi:riboflavin synthase